jgi:hypothetical protein
MTSAAGRSGVTAVLAALPAAAVKATRSGPNTFVITAPGLRVVLSADQYQALLGPLLKGTP